MRRIVSASTLLLVMPLAAEAQDWDFRASLYAWTPGLDTTIGTPAGELDASLSISDVLNDLDAAFMGTFEAQHGRWGLIGDLIYSDLTSSKGTPFGALYSKGKVETQLTAFTGYLAYRVWESDEGVFDFGAGFRSIWLDTTTTLEAGRLPTYSASADDSWTDPVLAARARVNIDEHWFATALADGGGYWDGSSSTWQVFASIGYQFNPTWSMQVGYRYMNIEKEQSRGDLSMAMSGPLIGVSASF